MVGAVHVQSARLKTHHDARTPAAVNIVTTILGESFCRVVAALVSVVGGWGGDRGHTYTLSLL